MNAGIEDAVTGADHAAWRELVGQPLETRKNIFIKREVASLRVSLRRGFKKNLMGQNGRTSRFPITRMALMPGCFVLLAGLSVLSFFLAAEGARLFDRELGNFDDLLARTELVKAQIITRGERAEIGAPKRLLVCLPVASKVIAPSISRKFTRLKRL